MTSLNMIRVSSRDIGGALDGEEEESEDVETVRDDKPDDVGSATRVWWNGEGWP